MGGVVIFQKLLLIHMNIYLCSSCPVNGVPWPQEPGRRNSHTFNCRMLKRPPDEVDSENPEARQQYEIMQCFTVSQPQSMQEDGEGMYTNKKYSRFPRLCNWILIITTSGSDKRTERMGTCIFAHIIFLLYLTSCGFRVFPSKSRWMFVFATVTADILKHGLSASEHLNAAVRYKIIKYHQFL